MTTLVVDHSEAVCAFVARGIFEPGEEFGLSVGIGFANPEEGLVAGFVFHNFNPRSKTIEVSGYSTRRDWINKAHLKALFAYPFEQLGCRIVVARHSERNTRARRIWKALGANEVIIPQLRGPNEGEAVATLLAKDWQGGKFMRQKHG